MGIDKKEFLILTIIFVFFVFLHIPGLHVPYHQDENKWVYYSHTELNPPGTIPHPPLTEFIYTKLGPVVGDNNFRFIPFAFGIINFFLLFFLVKIISNSKIALWTVFLFVVSFYSILASLMVDVDGAVMPMFFLMMCIGYFKLRNNNFRPDSKNWLWLILFLLGSICGFLVKVSGALPIAAIALDFALIKGVFDNKKRFFKFIGLGVLVVLGLVLVMFLAKIVFPFFPIQKSLKYWEHFANSSSFFGRGWFQTFIQFAKSLLYTSPLLITPAFFVSKEIWQKVRPFFLFIFIGIFFYIFVFDFSIGALDRYFQFLVIPFCVISGAVFGSFAAVTWKRCVLPVILSSIIFFSQFFNHVVPPLYPKTEWLGRLIHLKWNFLFPFTGGSGPTGFYISFLFMALMWFCSLVFLIIYFVRKDFKAQALIFILVLGITYNAVFIEEHFFGRINGSSYAQFEAAKEFIINNKNIKNIVVYNDIGGFEIQQTGKYARRLYAAPQFEDTYKKFFNDFSGHILFIDIPRIDAASFYSAYFNGCKNIYEKQDKYIQAQVLDCLKK